MGLAKDKLFVLIGIMLALFLSALDQTIVATALPQIVEDLHGVNKYAWVATAYLVASTTLVPVYGKMADIYSRKKIEISSVFIFLSGSFLCGMAGEFGNLPILGDGMNQLIVFRAIQGLGSAGLFSMAFVIIADLFPPAERGKYQGFIGAVFGISSILGPWLGGLLTDYGGNIIPGIAGWRWVFYVNVPFGIIALWFLFTKLPLLKPEASTKKINYFSVLLLIVGLAPLVIALQMDKVAYAWTAPITLSLIGISLLSLTAFVLVSLKSKNPVLDFALFKNKIFSTCNLSLFFIGAVFFSIIIFIPLYMINVLGISATKAGISLIPLSLGLVTSSIVSGQLVSRFGHYKRWMLGGVLLLIVGVFLLSSLSLSTTYLQVLVYMTICGLGIGPSMPLYTLAIQNAVDPREIGQATSASQFFRQIGASLGIAILGTVLAYSLTMSFSQHLKHLPSGITLESLGTSTSKILANGGSQIREKLFAEAAKELSSIKMGNTQKAYPLLPKQLSTKLAQGGQSINPAVLEEAIHQNVENVYAKVASDIKVAFNAAISKIYYYSLFIAVLAFLSTLFVPEIPLRKSNEYSTLHVEI